MFNESKFSSANENDLTESKNLEYCIHKSYLKYKVILLDIKRHSYGKRDEGLCAEYFPFFPI